MFRHSDSAVGATSANFVNRADGISEMEGKAATVAASERGRERVSNSCLFAGSLGCGDDFVEAGITAQIVPSTD
jgi:hypothetical protein